MYKINIKNKIITISIFILDILSIIGNTACAILIRILNRIRNIHTCLASIMTSYLCQALTVS